MRLVGFKASRRIEIDERPAKAFDVIVCDQNRIYISPSMNWRE